MSCIFLTLSTPFTYVLLSYRLFGVSNSVNLYNKLSCSKFSINCSKSQLCHIYYVIVESIKIKSTSLVRKKCTRCIIIFGEKKMIIKYLDEELGGLILKHIKKLDIFYYIKLILSGTPDKKLDHPNGYINVY